MARNTIVRVEACISCVLVLLTWVGSQFFSVPIIDRLSFSPMSVSAGVGGGFLLAATIPIVAAPSAREIVLLRDLRRVWDTLLVRLTCDLRPADIVLLAIMSGASEELFFRGVLQPAIGIGAASFVFGLLHCVTLAYATWAGIIGALLGLAYVTTDNLVVPATMHMTYNLVALLYLRYWYPGRLEPCS